MTQLASDNFTEYGPSYPVNLSSGNWTLPSGFSALKVSASGVVEGTATSTCVAEWTGLSWPNDQYSEVTFDGFGAAYSGPAVRLGSSAGYAALCGLSSDHNIYIQTLNNGSNIASHGYTPGSNDVIRLLVVGNVLSVYQNGSLVFSYTDTSNTFTSGNAGIACGGTSNAPLFTAWDGGNTATTSPISASITGTSSVTADLAGSGALASSITGTGTVSATLNGFNLSASILGVGTVSGTLQGAGALESSIAGVATVSADLTGFSYIVSAILGTSTIDAALVGSGKLSGSVNGLAVVSGTLTGLAALLAEIYGQAVVSGELQGLTAIACEIFGIGIVTATGTANFIPSIVQLTMLRIIRAAQQQGLNITKSTVISTAYSWRMGHGYKAGLTLLPTPQWTIGYVMEQYDSLVAHGLIPPGAVTG